MKAQLGKSIEWLGVTLSLTTKDGRPGVMVTIPADKCTDIVKEIDELLDAAGMAQDKKIRSVAGRVGWIAGFVPWAKAFASILYAAAHCKPAPGLSILAQLNMVAQQPKVHTEPCDWA